MEDSLVEEYFATLAIFGVAAAAFYTWAVDGPFVLRVASTAGPLVQSIHGMSSAPSDQLGPVPAAGRHDDRSGDVPRTWACLPSSPCWSSSRGVSR